MLFVNGQAHRFCDGIRRRDFLAAGTLSALGLSLADLLRVEEAQAVTGGSKNKRSVILIWQHGGPSQLDTFDMKPDAPREVRGPWTSIPSRLPGLHVSELMPHHAAVMDKMTVIRSFSQPISSHFTATHWMLTGYKRAGSTRHPTHPSMGAQASFLLGSKRRGVPSYVNINDGGFGYHGAAYLGVAHNPMRTGSFSYGNEGIQFPTVNDSAFKLIKGLDSQRVSGRVSLLKQLDTIRREVDRDGSFTGIDRMTEQAVDIVTSGRATEAFDLSKEDQKTRDRYGEGWGEQALLARRLVEAGVRFVTLNTWYWDNHSNIQGALDGKMPHHDRCVGVLVEDLAQRAMQDDTLVISAGEFGRTPKINKNRGRDHWGPAQSIVLAGGGYLHGQVIGATDKHAAFPTERPIGVSDFCTIIFHALGIDPNAETIDNLSGRPIYLVEGGQVPPELI